MERSKLIARYAQSGEDEVLFARVFERIERAETRGMPGATCFLSPREQALLRAMLGAREGLGFYGGPHDAERCVAYWTPEWEDPEGWLTGDDSPICAVRATFYEKDELTHRDFLGGLMGCGIKREVLGDILVQPGQADILVLREMADYLVQNFVSAGRTKLHVERIALSELALPELKTKQIRDTVASLRLDGVVSSAFSIARGKASSLIAAGKCSLNDLPCEKTDKPVQEGDRIAIRGLGKAVLTQVGGNTKKGRISIEITRFL